MTTVNVTVINAWLMIIIAQYLPYRFSHCRMVSNTQQQQQNLQKQQHTKKQQQQLTTTTTKFTTTTTKGTVTTTSTIATTTNNSRIKQTVGTFQICRRQYSCGAGADALHMIPTYTHIYIHIYCILPQDIQCGA